MTHSPTSIPTPGQRRQVHDTALRGLMEADTSAVCNALGIRLPGEPQILTASLPTATFEADLVMRTEPGQLVQVEYMRTGARDLVARMLMYRGLILRTHPRDHLTQYVVILGGGHVKGFDDLGGLGFAIDLKVIYLRDLDPGPFLATPRAAPLAALGRGSPQARARALEEALRLIGGKADDTSQHALLEFATTLARITLKPGTIEKIVTEVAMSTESVFRFALDSEFGHYVLDRGRQEGRRQMLLALLRERFGEIENIEPIAQRLTHLSDSAALRAITAATTLADLER